MLEAPYEIEQAIYLLFFLHPVLIPNIDIIIVTMVYKPQYNWTNALMLSN